MMHPGYYLKEEMEERGWLPRDLALILGVDEAAINVILSGERGFGPEMAKSLGNAFDVPAEFFANLQELLAQRERSTSLVGSLRQPSRARGHQRSR